MRFKEWLQDDSGFSLVEVMLAMVILALVTLPIINYYTYSSVRTIDGREKQTATMAAEDAAEELKAYSNFEQIEKLVATPDPAATATPMAGSTDTYTVSVYNRYTYAGTLKDTTAIKNGLKRVICIHIGQNLGAVAPPVPTVTPTPSPTPSIAPSGDGEWEVDPSPLPKYTVAPMASPQPMDIKKTIKINGFEYLAKVHFDYDMYDSNTTTVSGGSISSEYNDYYIPSPSEVYSSKNVVATSDDEVDVAVSAIYTDMMSGVTGAITKEVLIEEAEIRKDNLESIFVFYKPAWDSTNTEHFELTLDPALDNVSDRDYLKKLSIYLTYQEVSGVAAPNVSNIGTYALEMDSTSSDMSVLNLEDIKFYSNLNRPDYPDNSINVTGKSWFKLQKNALGKFDSYVKKRQAKRISKVYVDVFNKQDTDCEELLAHVESTFAE